ncbi:EF hand family protein [Aphelenchoides bicaudatus]|nr:EF hand family protein [Aphelenchoides bicaudatus]
MNGDRSTFSFSSTRNQEPFLNDFKSIYDDRDEFFDTVRNFPSSGRQSVPVGFRAGELSSKNLNNESNDTSSGYSTASSIAPSSSTYWTRKSDNDSEFVPIKEEEDGDSSDTNTFAENSSTRRPAWRQNKKNPPSVLDLLHTYDQFNPEPILQRAVAASERVAQYVNETPRFRRPQTALADPFPSTNRPQSTSRRGSTGASTTVDLKDFPSTNRGDVYALRQRYPNGPTANPNINDYNLSPRPTHRTVSLPQNNQWLNVQIPNSAVDTSALDSVLQSPGRGSEPVHLQQRSRTQDDFFAPLGVKARRHLDLDNEYFSDDPMAKATSNWKNSFANVRDRFGDSDVEDEPLFRSSFATDGSVTMPRNGQKPNFLSKSASQNTLERRPNDRSSLLDGAVSRRANEAPEERYNDDDRPRARLGDFWLETVRNRLDAAPNFQRAFSPRLTAAERLEQLHEPIEGDGRSSNRETPIREHLVYRRPDAADNVASRRAQYLKEMFRSQSPSVTGANSYSGRSGSVPADTNANYSSNLTTTNSRMAPNFAPIDNALADMNRSGCGRFPTTNELKYSTTTNNPDGSKTRSYFGQTSYNTGDGNIVVTTTRASTQHSPSPDTLSDTSQSSVAFLPHPKPTHNLRDQLMNAGIGSSFFSGFPGRRLLTNGPFSTNLSTSSSPNFPATNNVASRISALEKRPGAPNLLQLACVLGNNDNSNAPMSPRSTVFKTKPVIHVDYGSVPEEIIKRDDTNVFRFPSTTNKIGSNQKNDIGGFSPKWRDDVILNEASPLHHRLSMDNAPVQTTAFRDEHQNKLYSSPQISSNAQTTKQVAFNGSATPKQPATVQPLQRNGSPSLTEKPNATIAGANRQPVQNSFSQQPKQQPVAQKTLSSTLVSNKTPISSSTTFGTVPTANLTTSTFNAAPIQQNKQPPALQNRSPHALPHQPVVQHRPAAKPQQPRQPNIAGRLANCPQFHYPAGRPIPRAENDAVREKVRQLFNANTAHPQQLEYKDMDKLCQAIGLAVYSKRAVYEACMRLNAVTVDPNMTILPSMTLNQFNTYWQLMTADCHDEASRFIFTLAAAATGERKPRTYLVRDDFTNILVDLIHTYPGLSFLVNSTQFHSKYCEVVIVRIFWNVNRSWTGRITAHELRKSDFLPTLHLLETISDINKITDYFSYEHFYVAYCKFWELDTNHDLIIDREDMRQHCNGAIPDVVIDRVFSGAVMRNIPKLPVKTKGPVKTLQVETIGFEDFVAFLLAEEDKKHPTSVEYWFRQATQHNFDTLAFRDVACNLFDSIAPSTRGFVTLKELKKCGLAHRFFNTFVNYLKYLEQESSEGERASVKSSGDREMSDWETYCALEYELLLTDNDVEYDENIDLTLDDSEEKNVATKTVE